MNLLPIRKKPPEGYRPITVPKTLKMIYGGKPMSQQMLERRNEPEFQIEVVEKEGFQAVGLKWEGPSDGDIGGLQDKMVERIHEVANVINPKEILGIAYHHRGNGNDFTLYLCVRVSEVENIPNGMSSVTVAPLTYANLKKPKELPVDEAYTKLHRYMDSNSLVRQSDHNLNIEVYSTNHKCSSKQPFEMNIYIPVEIS